MGKKYSEQAKVFKAFDDETRLMIMELLRGGEKCACVLVEKMPVAQSTLSHHMKVLVTSGVVSARNEGKWTHYSISKEGSKIAAKLLNDTTTLNAAPDGDECKGRCC
jgi:ArsR family transcriptional regulator